MLTLHPLKPDFSRVNPFEGAKRLVSPRSLIELGKSLLKLTVVGYVALADRRRSAWSRSCCCRRWPGRTASRP